MIKLTLTEKAIKEKVIFSVNKKIDQQVEKIVNEVNKKTVIYTVWSLSAILMLVIKFPKIVFYIASVIMVLVIFYFMVEFFQSLKKVLIFINDFDHKIKRSVEQEIKQSMEGSVKNKLGLWLSGQNQKDIEDFCISYSVRELARRFNQHKRSILVRITTYTITVLLLKEILFKLFL